MKHSLTVIIPTYNGLSLLKKHLPQIIKHSGEGTKIIIVDDGSIDGTVEWLGKEHAQVACIHNDENLGFTKSVNLGARNVITNLFVLLNNDVAVTRDYLSSAVKRFDDPKVFAVTLNETKSSWPLISFGGKLNYTRAEDKTKAYFSAWASGGSAIFRTRHWQELGGFDEVYSPGYWEDIDLGWRAWKAGYKIIWDPRAKVVHEHESTFNRYDRNHLNFIKQRNELVFNWKNTTDENLRREHLRYLARYTLNHPGYLKVILSALMVLPKIRRGGPSVRGDLEVLQLVNRPV